MAEKNRASLLFVVEEAVEGTYEPPSLADQAIALQEGFSFSPGFEQQENAEIRAGIGESKAIQGLESPEGSFDHYLRHSGIEGQGPNYGKLLKSLLGDENLFHSPLVVNATNNKLNFTDDDGTVTATIASGTYRHPDDLAAAVATAMNAANGTETASCTFSEVTGKFTISSTGAVLSLLWKTGANGSDNTDTHIGTLLGYSDAADDTLATSYLADNAAGGIERVTAGGSTVSSVVLTAGGSSFARGYAVLVKEALYEVRPVHSVNSNTLTLGFDLENAPGAGISVGQCINYAPLSEGHAKLSLTLYRGNGGAVEAMAGSQVSECAITVEAGVLINASYSFEGTKYFYNPVTITSANEDLDFEDDDGVVVATITNDTYRDPHEFADAVQAAMQAANPAQTPSVTYDDATGQYHIETTGTLLTLKWNTGANTATSIAAKLGFSTAADSSGTAATTGYTGSAVSLAASLTPAYDDGDPQVAKNNEVLIGDSDDITCFCAASFDITVTNEIENVPCVCAESGVQEKIINKRSIQINIVGILERYDADKFKKFRSNADVRFLFNLGSRSGGNWIPGTVASIYVPSATVNSHELGDLNGLVTMEIGVKPYVDSTGAGEFYINYL